MSNETSKCYEKRMIAGDFARYLRGRGLDVGCGADILRAPNATVDPWDQPQGSAELLPGVPDASYDFVYSSHCLEHLEEVESALENWARVIKGGGYLYLVVPDYVLYEKLCFPSMFSGEHRHTFSMTVSRAQVGRGSHWKISEDVTPILQKHDVSVIKSYLEDDFYDYNVGPGPDQTQSPNTLAQICLIGRKGDF